MKNILHHILNAANYLMLIKLCNLQDASFFPFQPSLIKQGSELHRNAIRSLVYTDS